MNIKFKWRFLAAFLTLALSFSAGVSARSSAQEENKPIQKMTVERIAGENRYMTAVKMSRHFFKNPVKAVVLASGESFADALTGGSLTAQEKFPMLLVPQNKLPQEVREELQRLKPETVYIVGGNTTVSENVEKEVATLGMKVKRLAGRDRQETADVISGVRFSYFAPGVDGMGDLTAAFDGTQFADALAAAPFVAALAKHKIGFYTMHPFMKGDSPDGNELVFGGVSSVPKGKEEQERLSGADRYETAVKIAQAYTEKWKAEPEAVILADGTRFPDALSCAAVSGLFEAPVLLTEPTELNAKTAAYIKTMKNVKKIYIMGGENAVSPKVIQQIEQLVK